MNARSDFLEQQGRVPFAVLPGWLRRLTVALTVPATFLLLAAIVLASVGGTVGFDAWFAWIPAIVGGSTLAASMLILEGWQYVRQMELIAQDGPIELPPLSDVPERERMRASQARAVARRVVARRAERQRAARNQTAASGGSVSSTEAGLPPHGSSEATTEP